jgi:predicted membrane channel-forming protein YqfA (hemolysin III family)
MVWEKPVLSLNVIIVIILSIVGIIMTSQSNNVRNKSLKYVEYISMAICIIFGILGGVAIYRL